MNQDLQHLKLLSIFHYVAGGVMALFSCLPMIYVVMGIAFIVAGPAMFEGPGQPPPPWFGWILVILGGTMVSIGWAIAACVVATGRFLANRSHHLFCLIMGGIECLFTPLGTVLGIFTIIVLMRESVKELFFAEPGTTQPFATQPFATQPFESET